MQHDHEEQPLWLQWFLSWENIDEAALRAALRVVPNEFWPSVKGDISRGLSELSTREERSAGDALGGHAATFPTRRTATLEMKKDLLAQEARRRASS